MLRLFVGLEIPDDLRLQLAALQAGVPGARWVTPENFHITLRFIGEVDEGHAADIDALLQAIRVPAFELSLSGVGHFGDGRKLRALYAAVAPNTALEHLHDKVESAVVRAGCAPEGGKYKPHVTLARFGARDQAGHHLAQFMASHSLLRSAPFLVEQFSLFSSLTRPEGAIYMVEADYPLSLISPASA
jgi:2'-5' RNA ligase